MAVLVILERHAEQAHPGRIKGHAEAREVEDDAELRDLRAEPIRGLQDPRHADFHEPRVAVLALLL